MEQVAAHAEECDSCHAEYQQLRATQRMVAGLGRRQAPPDLALQLRIALSVERTKSYRRRWEGMLVRWENAFNAFMFPATPGLLSAVIFFVMIIGFYGLPGNRSASSDLPFALYTPPQLNRPALPFVTTIATSEGSFGLET